MRKILSIFMMVTIMMVLTACGEKETTKEPEYTVEQQELAKQFSTMIDEYNKVVEKVNNNEVALSYDELVDVMNQLSEEITIVDGHFTDPKNLTSEVMASIKTAIESVNSFVELATTTLAEIESEAQEAEVVSLIVPIEIMNFTGVDIHVLTLSPASSNTWGSNMISEVIYNGETVAGELIFTRDTLVWDILIQDAVGNELNFMGVDFSEVSVDGAKLVLETTEGGKYFATVN